MEGETAFKAILENDRICPQIMIYIHRRITTTDLLLNDVFLNDYVTDGKARACEHDVKYIETSVAINHNVNELLVGILTQIRLKAQMVESENKKKQCVKRKPTSMRTRNRRSSKGLIDKLLGIGENVKSKSCDNLYVL